MAQWTPAEQYLLEQIRQGSEEAWTQLIERYQGRLHSFARRRLPRGADPEDLVQETFLRFLRNLKAFRADSSIETYLFMILRRQIVDLFRGRKFASCQLSESGDDSSVSVQPAAPDATASTYARRDEQREQARAALTTALSSLVRSLQENLDFTSLELAELLFYAQRPNRHVASVLGISPEQVALTKHRWLKQVRERVELLQRNGPGDLPPGEALDSLLTEIWEEQRPSCLKRSTVGSFMLGTLDEPWRSYAQFHLNTLGCAFCRANLEDLQKQTAQGSATLRNRILQSTVGFFRKR